MKRRAFIAALGGAAAWPMVARGQQQPVMPVIGFLSSRSPGESDAVVAAFRKGLSETGFVEGRNAVIAFRWAEGQYERLPARARIRSRWVKCRRPFGRWWAPVDARREGGNIRHSNCLLGDQRPRPLRLGCQS